MSRQSRSAAGALAADALCVVAFVVAGRRSHDEASSIAGLLRVAAPFLVALGLAWLVAALRGRRHPSFATTMFDPQRGVVVALATAAIGMALRRGLWGGGTAVAFVVVTAAGLVAAMAGWRLVWRWWNRRTGAENGRTSDEAPTDVAGSDDERAGTAH
jgi:predicted permease